MKDHNISAPTFWHPSIKKHHIGVQQQYYKSQLQHFSHSRHGQSLKRYQDLNTFRKKIHCKPILLHRKETVNMYKTQYAILTYLMVTIKKDAITAISNSDSCKMSSQQHYCKTCPSYGIPPHPLRIVIWKTTDIKLKQADQHYCKQQPCIRLNSCRQRKSIYRIAQLTALPADAKK